MSHQMHWVLFAMLVGALMPAGVAQPLNFDITIPSEYAIVDAGSPLIASVRIANLGDGERADVLLDFWTEGPSGEVTRMRETVAVETQANFVRRFDIPANAQDGRYLLHAKVTDVTGREALSSASFEVRSHPLAVLRMAGIALAAALAFGLVAFAAWKQRGIARRWALRARIHQIVSRRKR